jgi:hypothetical protein
MGRLFKKWTRTALAAGWVLLAGGCAGPSGATVPSQSAPPAQPAPSPAEADKRFIIAPELESVLRVKGVGLSHPPEGYLKIQVNVENMTATPQRFSYRIEWFDQDGAPLPVDGEGFSPWMLRPHEVSSISATAPAQSAADFGIAFVPAVN